MKTKMTLLKSRSYIRKNGWAPEYDESNDGITLYEAICYATGTPYTGFVEKAIGRACKAVLKAAGVKPIPFPEDALIEWHERTTEDEVMDALDKAINAA